MKTKLALRRLRFRCLLTGRSEQAATIAQVLGDDELCRFVCSELDATYQEACLVGSALTDFFEWLIENSDEIIAFIMLLIEIFSAL